eukprot:g6396.t1
MAAAAPDKVEETKPVLVEEDDEFEEFADKDWKEETEEDGVEKQWEEDWDEVDIQDDFCKQLRAELEKGAPAGGKA